MELLEAIKCRRSIRSYTEEEVTDDELNAILEAATWAPTPCNKQSWRFVVVRKPETIEKLYGAASYSTQHQIFVKKAKIVIVVCTDLGLYRTFPHKERALSLFTIQETAAATQNLLLTAHALGLGACWVSLFSEDQVKGALNLPKDIRPLVILPLGHTKSKTHPKPRKPLKDVVRYESY
ncbi:MAG TPA: nitroreductase family protein [Patescibacteria group bacterium]|nr:nitroreductase family protein [Patescibacteria group bacterium]